MRVDESNKSSGSHCHEVLYVQEQADLALILGEKAAHRRDRPANAVYLSRLWNRVCPFP